MYERYSLYTNRELCVTMRAVITPSVNTFDAGVYSYGWFRINSFTCIQHRCVFFSSWINQCRVYVIALVTTYRLTQISLHFEHVSIEQQEQRVVDFFGECQKWYWLGKYKGMARGGIRFEIACLEWSSRSRNFVRDVFFFIFIFSRKLIDRYCG